MPIEILRRARLVTTKVFDTYWRFATERQAVFMNRLERRSPPWTTDWIIQQHKFTNVYRACDRVSQFLIAEVIYKGSQAPEEVFFRTLLFKIFNKIDTWLLLKQAFGAITFEHFDRGAYGDVLALAKAQGARIYSGAYIMPSGSAMFHEPAKHRVHLRILERMMSDDAPLRLRDSTSLDSAFRVLRSYPLLGDFLAYQYVIDLNYSDLINFSEMDFVLPGPGAKSGIAKCFTDTGGLSEADVIRWVTERQEMEFASRQLSFRTLHGRSLQLIDCQNVFCEVDKYSRLAHPDVVIGRTHIKQRFKPNYEPIDYWFPPKWGLNAITVPAETR